MLSYPEFYKPGEIDKLLGVEIFYDILCVDQIQLARHQAKMTKTKLGWIISCKIGNSEPSKLTRKCLVSTNVLQKEILADRTVYRLMTN